METDGARLAPLALDDPAEIGAFRLIGRLGAGGMGVVYFGRDTSGYPAAVKTVRAEYAADPGYRARFLREVDLARRVRGRCIAPLLAAGPEEARPWLAVAYVPGPTLQSHLAESGPLRGGDLTAFAAGLAEALAAIHREGIVHRDLKPENVILSPEGPKVLDFGIAQALDEVSMTRMDMVVGTPGWISPERYDGERAGPASDMFCWGGLVALAASGRLPFGTGPVEVLRYRTVNEEPDSAADVLPEALHDVVQRALSRDPADRPDADEVFTAITGESIDEADAPAAQAHMTRVATRLIDADWSLPVADASALFPSEPVRANTARRPITFAGASVHEPARLAELFRQHSERAEHWLRRDGAGRLREWLDDIGDAVYDRDYLRGIASVEQAAVAVTAFVAGYLRESVPMYRGREVGVEGLRRLAAGGPADFQLLSEIVLNEIPLIAAAHGCGHPGCQRRCARLEHIGLQTRPVVDGALTAAARIGLRPAPAERDRAVAIAIETIDDSTRRAAVRDVTRAWSALPVPWWRHVALRALRADPTTAEGRSALVLARLAAPYASAAAAPAWRRALAPQTWMPVGGIRVFLLAFVLWCTGGTAWGAILYAGGRPMPETEGSIGDYATVLDHAMVVWPVFLLMAIGLAFLPARRRLGGVIIGTLIMLFYASAAPDLPAQSSLVPDLIRLPLISSVNDLGTTSSVPFVLVGLVAMVLFFWLLASLPRDPEPFRVARPLLHGSNGMVRTVVGVVAVGLAVWLPLWSLMIMLAPWAPDFADASSKQEVRDVFGALAVVVLPAAIAFGAVALLFWRVLGGHLIYLGFIAELVLFGPLAEFYLSTGISGPGTFTASLALDQPVTATWIGLLCLPASYGYAAWLCERLRYRRPPKVAAPPGGYPPYGYGTPMPGFGTPYPGAPMAGRPVPTPYPGGPVTGPGGRLPGPPAPPPGQWTRPPQGYPATGPHLPQGPAPARPQYDPTRVQPDSTRVQPDPTRVQPDPTRIQADPTRVSPDQGRTGVDPRTGGGPTWVQPGDTGATQVRPQDRDPRTEIVPNPEDRPDGY